MSAALGIDLELHFGKCFFFSFFLVTWYTFMLRYPEKPKQKTVCSDLIFFLKFTFQKIISLIKIN